MFSEVNTCEETESQLQAVELMLGSTFVAEITCGAHHFMWEPKQPDLSSIFCLLKCFNIFVKSINNVKDVKKKKKRIWKEDGTALQCK